MRYPSQLLKKYNGKLIENTNNPSKYILNNLKHVMYLEVQIHFTPKFNEAFESVCVPERYRSIYGDKFEEFSKKNDIELVWY
jgi:hypothetical protein